MNLKLKIWRQQNAHAQGKFVDYTVENISPDTSFLEMLDILNNKLIQNNEEPVVFDHDCREGICGMCSLHINGHAHGPDTDITTCQLHMRKFKDGDTITIEPWRSRAFPVIKDLAVDRSAYDKILQAGGFISVNTGGVPDANTIPIPKPDADESMDAAACIGCGACVATCKNGSAMLFVAAGTRRSGPPRQSDGRQDGRTRIRGLHQHRRLRSGMSERDLDRPHRPVEPRIPFRQTERLSFLALFAGVDPASETKSVLPFR